MSYRLIDANEIAIKYPEVNEMDCIYVDLPNGLDNEYHYIDAESNIAIKTIDWYHQNADEKLGFNKITCEAEPIKRGTWIWNKRLEEWYCSNCDRIMKPYTVEKSEGVYEMAQPFYCGWCGAKMDGGEK